MNCPLCKSAGDISAGDVPVESILWQDDRCRVIAVDEPGYPGFCRVIWSAHAREMTDLAPGDRQHLMKVVFAVESALREFALARQDQPRLAGQSGTAPALARHPALRRRSALPRPDMGGSETGGCNPARRSRRTRQPDERVPLGIPVSTPLRNRRAISMPTIVITGANRGIGFEFVKQYAGRDWQVIATARDPVGATALADLADRRRSVRIERLDLVDPRSIESFIGRLGTEAIDVLINNAALLGPAAPQLLGRWDDDSFIEAYRTNVIGPARLTEGLLPLIDRGELKKIVFLGSAAGSITSLRAPPNLYAYRASKAALHLIARNLSFDLRERGIMVALINPGLVDTRGLLDLAPEDPGPPDFRHIVRLVRDGVIPLIRPDESVDGMIRLIDTWSPERSGTILNYDGTPMPR